jgi:hypothetical protein
VTHYLFRLPKHFLALPKCADNILQRTHNNSVEVSRDIASCRWLLPCFLLPRPDSARITEPHLRDHVNPASLPSTGLPQLFRHTLRLPYSTARCCTRFEKLLRLETGVLVYSKSTVSMRPRRIFHQLSSLLGSERTTEKDASKKQRPEIL